MNISLENININELEKSLYITIGEKILKLSIDEILSNSETVSTKTTIVTGLWNIGRGEINESFKRSYSFYLEKFAELLKAPVPMYIYVSKEDEEFIWKHRSKHNTVIKILELEEFETWFEFYQTTQDIRKNSDWYNQAGWLPESPQASLKYYNPIVMSKMFMLNDATIANPFNSENFFWIDAAITNTVHPGYFSHDKVFNNLTEYINTTNGFIFLSYPYEGGEEIHGFSRKEMAKYCSIDYVRYVCRGGFFGGNIHNIHEINSIYYQILSHTLEKKLMGTEESIFTIIAHTFPDKIDRFQTNDDGMIWPFFEKLKNIKEFTKNPVPRVLTYKNTKVNLYVLGFNSPKQFESVINSIKLADNNMFTASRKILINNSTDTSTFEEYDTLCKQNSFEEIHRDNLGVCGGRQFIAEHFEESDANFYMFFEDDMLLNDESMLTETCRNGFRKYVSNIYSKIVGIMLREKFDFLKLSFSEFYGDNSVQWAWYNVPQNIRTEMWPEYDKLPSIGIDPNAPKTNFKNISIYNEVAYATGEIYYSNWPQIVSREGNKKMFLDTKWEHPYEQTWMSYMYQLTKQNKLNPAILLASPITHDRFDHYDGSLRKES